MVKLKKKKLVPLVIFLCISIFLYFSIHVVHEDELAYVITAGRGINNVQIKGPGLTLGIPFIQKMYIFTPYDSGEIRIYNTDVRVSYSYIVNKSHYKNFVLYASFSHEFIRVMLSIKLNKHFENRDNAIDNENVKDVATQVFSDYLLNDKKSEANEALFKKVKLNVRSY
jgi:NADH:ubiquinone oxidoreductase subunit 6 (subunit J)